jgi:DNA-binding transcriptional LysR family regulator
MIVESNELKSSINAFLGIIMKYPVDAVEAFLKVCECLSFNKAAQQLNISQTALSRRIQRLEEIVELRLIDRTTRTVTVTTVGESFIPEAQRILADLDRSFKRLQRIARFAEGTVTLGTNPSMMLIRLPEILRNYSRKFPHSKVEILDRTSDHVIDAVRQGYAEIGLHVRYREQPDLEQRVIATDPFVLYVRPDLPIATRHSVTWSDLVSVDLITLGGNTGNRPQVEIQLSAAGHPPSGRFSVEQFASALGLASAGVGAAILARSSLQGTHWNLKQIPIADPVVSRDVILTKRRNETLTPSAQGLYEAIVETFEGELVESVIKTKPAHGFRRAHAR